MSTHLFNGLLGPRLPIRSLSGTRLAVLCVIPGLPGASIAAAAEPGIALTHVGSTSIEIVLAWTPVRGASEYRLQRSASADLALSTT